MGDHDIVWYILHYYCLWGVVSASLTYSCRFNDEDSFHKLLWSAFLVAMLFQQVYLYHSLEGFAGITAVMYLLIIFAHARVAILLPRARKFCLSFIVGHSCQVLPLALLAFLPIKGGSDTERALLWVHLCVEPCH